MTKAEEVISALRGFKRGDMVKVPVPRMPTLLFTEQGLLVNIVGRGDNLAFIRLVGRDNGEFAGWYHRDEILHDD